MKLVLDPRASQLARIKNPNLAPENLVKLTVINVEICQLVFHLFSVGRVQDFEKYLVNQFILNGGNITVIDLFF